MNPGKKEIHATPGTLAEVVDEFVEKIFCMQCKAGDSMRVALNGLYFYHGGLVTTVPGSGKRTMSVGAYALEHVKYEFCWSNAQLVLPMEFLLNGKKEEWEITVSENNSFKGQLEDEEAVSRASIQKECDASIMQLLGGKVW